MQVSCGSPLFPGRVGGARGRAEPGTGGPSGAQLTGAPRLVPLPPPVPDQGEGCCVPRRHQRWEQGPAVLHEGQGTGSAPAGLGGSGTNQRPPPQGSARSALTPPEPRPGDASCPPHRQGPPVSPPTCVPPPPAPRHAPPRVSPSSRLFISRDNAPRRRQPPLPRPFRSPTGLTHPVRPSWAGRVRTGAERGARAQRGSAGGGGGRGRGGGQGAGVDINNRGPSPSPS